MTLQVAGVPATLAGQFFLSRTAIKLATLLNEPSTLWMRRRLSYLGIASENFFVNHMGLPCLIYSYVA
jgi:hypothetical protein